MFSLSEGLGFNTNVLETNILNLAVVIAIVVIYVGDAVAATLDERRARIVKSVQTADEKYNAAQEALRAAQARLEEASGRAATIRSEGSATVQQVTRFVNEQAAEELGRLAEVKTSTLALAEQKAAKEIQTSLVARALVKAGSKLSTRLTSQATQKAFVDLQIQTLRTKA